MPLSHPPRAIAIVGLGCILPDALDVPTFWNNITTKRYSITETPTDRWSVASYYDPDPHAPDKTYSKIGGWVRGFSFDWRRWRMPPKVVDSMDQGQQWAVSIAADALADYGYPDRPLDTERTAVILGTAMGGELHYATHLRISFPEYANALAQVDEFSQLPARVRETILANWHTRFTADYAPITEDSMPGELPNIVSGRVANMLNLRGPNFITDAACASSFAAINAAFEMLTEGHVDAVISGGVDRNMGVSSFVKFCKIGALSATGTRPFGDGADGFVMGEGAAAFLLKRLEDAERDGDKIYAVVRGVGGASDGKGKGITAPNPVGQQLAIQRAWENAGIDPATATLIEAHGTSTRVGDVVEVESLAAIFGGAAKDSIALGSVKSNIGHLKAGAGAAGLLKATLALHHKTIPPTLNARPANPNINFATTPFRLAHDSEEWRTNNGTPRRAGVSAYGFGGTNFHLVIEEHIPGMLTSQSKSFAVEGSRLKVESSTLPTFNLQPSTFAVESSKLKVESATFNLQPSTLKPLRGILALGADTPTQLKEKLDATLARVESGWTPPIERPSSDTLRATERLVIDFGTHDELLDRLHKAQKAMGFDNPAAWKAMEAQGLFRGAGPKPGKIAFMFPGQGSQYANMGRKLADVSPAVAEVFAEADRIMEPILGKPLTSYLFVDEKDPMAVMKAEIDLMQTEITQPAMLTLDIAMYKLLAQYGFGPDVVMGHSLGEYAALIAAGVMPFAHALEATAARGAEMAAVDVPDKGKMAAVIAPYDEVEAVLKTIDGYVVPANINSHAQSVIGGESAAVEKAFAAFQAKGFQAMMIPVSHAFHTRIVAPAGVPLRKVLDRLSISAPQLPIVANLTGEFYPTTPETIKDCLQQQVASPVQWVKSLHTLYNDGVRAFLEVGPKRALRGFANDVFKDKPGVIALLTNHPKGGELETFNQALCGLYAAGYGEESRESRLEITSPIISTVEVQPVNPTHQEMTPHLNHPTNGTPISLETLVESLTKLIHSQPHPSPLSTLHSPLSTHPFDRNAPPLGSVVISGTGLGLPGAEKPLMDPDNALRILRGEQFVDLIPERFRKQILAKRITRLVKDEQGNGRFETIDNAGDVIKLAGRPGSFDLTEEYGVPQKLVDTLDITTQLAMAAGLDALREAGIPLVMTYKRTTTGKFLPERWMLPEALRDETGVIFASAFPGGDRFAEEFKRYYTWQNHVELLQTLEEVRRFTADPGAIVELNRRITTLRETMERDPYTFDRRFIFRILAMGHSQFAEYVGARGPNTQVNSACASTTQAIAIAEDWIRTGRARRVLVIAADDVTGENLLEWVGAGFLALGAAATDDEVDKAALPFDRRRHGTLLGMGAAALVIESEDAVRERGMRGIVELLSSETRNSAFHGSRLDVDHIHQVLNDLVTSAERRFGLNRYAMAQNMVFMSHETYTPARGGSAAAEVVALRNTFGEAASDIVVANTKGFTGHPMGVGIEDVIAIKILEHGLVPPVPNHREEDPDLGTLNLSRGGRYPVIYALHLAAGFGSQISFALYRRIPGALDRTDNRTQYQHWLDAVSGYDFAQTEVVKRNLRVIDKGAPTRAFAASSWQYGTGPAVRVFSEQYSVSSGQLPVVSSQPVPIPATAKIPIVPPLHPAPEPPKVTVVSPAVVETPKSEPAIQQVSASASRQVASQQVSQPTNERTNQPTAQPITPPTDTLTTRVLALVSAQTGYPIDILDPALDLEADLGVDTVKHAETFAAIRAEFNIPRKDDLKLRDYPTLAHVIQFVKDNSAQDLVVSGQSSVVSQPIASQRTNEPTNAPTNQPANDLVTRVLAIVSEQTGYPIDILDPALDLEADLGVDTVKQAETFAAIRTEFDIPRKEDLKLRDYPTLAHVIQFVKDNSAQDLVVSGQSSVVSQPIVSQPTSQPTNQPTDPLINPSPDNLTARVLAIVSEQTGYPIDILDPALDLEADLGVDTVKQAETFAAIRTEFDIPRKEDLKLRDYPTLAHVIQFVKDNNAQYSVVSGQSSVVSQPIASQQPNEPTNAPTNQPANDLVTRVLAIVSDQTGYPSDILELDLDLEADLGVDTVKQAETFAAIRAEFNIPRKDDLKLRDYPTLAHVIGFVKANTPHESRITDEPTSQQVASQPASQPVNEPTPPPTYSLESANLFPRRVPTPTLRPALEFCKPTGVKLDGNSRVIVAMDNGGVGKALVNRLEKLGVTVLSLDPTADTFDAQLQTCAEFPVQGVYWLPALDVEPALTDLDFPAWRELNRVRVKNLYTTMRALYEQVSISGTFLVSATRLGGLHGYGDDGATAQGCATAPLGGAVTGFTKAYKRERPNVLVKAVDFEPSRKTAQPAEVLLAETLTDPGIVEVGYRGDDRFTITLEDRPVDLTNQPSIQLTSQSVFLVTGAAGSITSAIVSDLAAASGGVFYLLDLVPQPNPADPKIALFRKDKAELQRVIIEEMKSAGERPIPAQIEKRVMAVERLEAALSAIEAVRAAGGTAHYHSVNLLDGDALTRVVDDIRARYGKLDVLVHAGGIEISRALPDKDRAQFDLVFDIKADGFFSLLKAAKDMTIGATVAFSSVAGRFGNAGQTDYAAANDLLCKLTSSFRQTRPGTRGIVIDWTAWGGIGMATRGSIPTVMKAAGIDMLPPESGIPTVRRELLFGGGEIVVGGKLGMLMEEWDATGGVDLAKFNAWVAEKKLMMVGDVKTVRLYGGLEAETMLDPNVQPFLFDHAMDGTPLLPGVMGVETFGELATVLAPGYSVAAVQNVDYHASFKFYRMEPQTMYLRASAYPSPNGLTVRAAILSKRTLATGEVQEKVHFTGEVALTSNPSPAGRGDEDLTHLTPSPSPKSGEGSISAEAVYKIYFHGPAYQVLEKAAVEGQQAMGWFPVDLPSNTNPVDVADVMSPRLIELCFQTAGVWQIQSKGEMALPLGIESVTRYVKPDGQKLVALVESVNDGEKFNAQVVDEAGTVYVDLKGYRTVVLPGSVKF